MENCVGDVVRVSTALRSKHSGSDAEAFFEGMDGMKGVTMDVRNSETCKPVFLKTQTFKTAVEAAAILLRIDYIVSGLMYNKDPVDRTGGLADDEYILLIIKLRYNSHLSE